jgi:lauroyl/myristoyl acyltransferase
MTRDPGAPISNTGTRHLHRPRPDTARASWQADDLVIAASLAGLLPFAWLLPERLWRGFCRAVARLPIVDRKLLAGNADAIRRCFAKIGQPAAMDLAVSLLAAVYELRLQNLRALWPGAWQPRIVLTGGEHLDAALAAGRGAVLWVGHFSFNSNVTKMALAARGQPAVHLSRPEHGFSKTRLGIALLNPLRCIPEDRTLRARIVYDRGNPAAAMRRMMKTLQENGLLTITAGTWEGSDVAEGAMLGGRIGVALGAPRLAARTGAALLPVFTVRRPDGAFEVAIEPPIGLPGGAARHMAETEAAQAYLRRHERWITAYPEQWRGWKEWRPG